MNPLCCVEARERTLRFRSPSAELPQQPMFGKHIEILRRSDPGSAEVVLYERHLRVRMREQIVEQILRAKRKDTEFAFRYQESVRMALTVLMPSRALSDTAVSM